MRHRSQLRSADRYGCTDRQDARRRDAGRHGASSSRAARRPSPSTPWWPDRAWPSPPSTATGPIATPWWPTSSTCARRPWSEPDPDLAFEPALRTARVEPRSTFMNDERWQRLVPALLLLKSEKPAIAELDDEMNRDQADVIGDVLRRGIARGRAAPRRRRRHRAVDHPAGRTDPDGRPASRTSPSTMSSPSRVVDQFLAANRARAASAST